MAEARLSFEERKTITILIQLFFFLKMCIFLAPSIYVYVYLYLYLYLYLSIYLSIYLSVCLSVCLSMHNVGILSHSFTYNHYQYRLVPNDRFLSAAQFPLT
jgi:hypothetical protein